MTAFNCLLFCSLLFAADEPKSAALMQTLPEDGSWVKFNVNVVINGAEVSPTWTMRSVGKADHDGKACRFIELEQTCPTPPLGNVTWRLLVPEAEFGEGKHPLGNARKVWVQYEKEEPQTVESIPIKDPIFGALIAGPTAEVLVLREREKVSWQRGNLESEVVTGTREIDFAGAKLQISHRVLRHRDIPFGLAGMRQELNAEFGGAKQQAKITMTLQDHGSDAKSKLPELKP